MKLLTQILILIPVFLFSGKMYSQASKIIDVEVAPEFLFWSKSDNIGNFYDNRFSKQPGFQIAAIYSVSKNEKVWFYTGLRFNRIVYAGERKATDKDLLYKIKLTSSGLYFPVGVKFLTPSNVGINFGIHIRFFEKTNSVTEILQSEQSIYKESHTPLTKNLLSWVLNFETGIDYKINEQFEVFLQLHQIISIPRIQAGISYLLPLN